MNVIPVPPHVARQILTTWEDEQAARRPKPIDDDALRESYGRLGNLWKVAAELGLSHSRVHRRLVALAIPNGVRRWTDDDKARLVRDHAKYAADGRLDDLADEMGRRKTNLCTMARKLGLTDQRRLASPALKEAIRAAAQGKWTRKTHPRGMAGKKHTDDTKAIVGAASVRNWEGWKATGTGPMAPDNLQRISDRVSARMAAMPAANAYSRTKSGMRADIGIFVRSAWEANYARYLNWLQARGDIERWEYEPETFWFEKIKRGVRSYKPDFKIWEKGAVYYIEVKGWMDPKSITRLRRMKKYHPNIDLRLFDERSYRDLASKLSRIIPHWEGSR